MDKQLTTVRKPPYVKYLRGPGHDRAIIGAVVAYNSTQIGYCLCNKDAADRIVSKEDTVKRAARRAEAGVFKKKFFNRLYLTTYKVNMMYAIAEMARAYFWYKEVEEAHGIVQEG